MKRYSQEQLINHLIQAKEGEIVFLLGAGCSIESGCMSASKLVNEFKKRIYCAKHGIILNDNTLIDEERLINKINEEFPSDMNNPYSYYFEKCFPNVEDRSLFIKENFQNIQPSYGYLCFANYLIENNIKTVMTTNFDNLIEKAIRNIDNAYDCSITSDNIKPMLIAKLNIVKLHGDYNYDYLRNTAEELDALSTKLMESINNIYCKEIVVIGYSGMDVSVMDMLRKKASKGIRIIWCTLEKFYNGSSQIESLFNGNEMSGYCFIEGFDTLFSKLYSVQGCKNPILDNILKEIKNDNFILNIDNQPEQMQFNANTLSKSPICYKIKMNISSAEIKEINNSNDNFYLAKYREFLYLIGDINAFVNKSESTNILQTKCSVCDENIPILLKCKLIKEFLKIYLRNNDICVYKDNIYLDNYQEIKEGLKLSIDLFNGKICLFTNVNYFVLTDKCSEKIKFSINEKKSKLFASKNYDLRKTLFDKLLGHNLDFSIYDTSLEFNGKPVDTFDKNSDFYNCSKEPEMQVENNYSVNQIQLLNNYGPRKTLFSADKIRIGVFCPNDDKQKLKKFLDLMIDGTKTQSAKYSIIPEYLGFFKTFKKEIIIEYDDLPMFSTAQIINKCNDDRTFNDFCLKGINKLYNEKNVDIVLIYISNKLVSFRSKNGIDFHDYIKLKCANSYKTQFLEEKTIDSSDDINKKVLNLAIGIYTKTIGMSWYPKHYSKNTLFLGMSFGKDVNGITVGCSQMFDGAGRGMQLLVSQISDKCRANQYLTCEEAYALGKRIRTTYYKTSKIEELKRIVIHRSSPFREEEIEGFKKAFEGIPDFDLIQVIDYTCFNSYCFKNKLCSGYPVRRGTTIKSSKDTAYVWTDGSLVSSDVLGGYTYRNSKRGMSSPLKIKKYYGNITMNEVVNDLMYLTKMDFNSADVLFSKLPVTLKYSKIVCDLLKQGIFEYDSISFQYIM